VPRRVQQPVRLLDKEIDDLGDEWRAETGAELVEVRAVHALASGAHGVNAVARAGACLYTTPFFMTNVTLLSTRRMFFVGSPATATTSASLPAASVPTRFSQPRSFAALEVAATIDCIGVSPPHSVSSTSS